MVSTDGMTPCGSNIGAEGEGNYASTAWSQSGPKTVQGLTIPPKIQLSEDIGNLALSHRAPAGAEQPALSNDGVEASLSSRDDQLSLPKGWHINDLRMRSMLYDDYQIVESVSKRRKLTSISQQFVKGSSLYGRGTELSQSTLQGSAISLLRQSIEPMSSLQGPGPGIDAGTSCPPHGQHATGLCASNRTLQGSLPCAPIIIDVDQNAPRGSDQQLSTDSVSPGEGCSVRARSHSVEIISVVQRVQEDPVAADCSSYVMERQRNMLSPPQKTQYLSRVPTAYGGNPRAQQMQHQNSSTERPQRMGPHTSGGDRRMPNSNRSRTYNSDVPIASVEQISEPYITEISPKQSREVEQPTWMCTLKSLEQFPRDRNPISVGDSPALVKEKGSARHTVQVPGVRQPATSGADRPPTAGPPLFLNNTFTYSASRVPSQEYSQPTSRLEKKYDKIRETLPVSALMATSDPLAKLGLARCIVAAITQLEQAAPGSYWGRSREPLTVPEGVKTQLDNLKKRFDSAQQFQRWVIIWWLNGLEEKWVIDDDEVKSVLHTQETAKVLEETIRQLKHQSQNAQRTSSDHIQSLEEKVRQMEEQLQQVSSDYNLSLALATHDNDNLRLMEQVAALKEENATLKQQIREATQGQNPQHEPDYGHYKFSPNHEKLRPVVEELEGQKFWTCHNVNKDHEKCEGANTELTRTKEKDSIVRLRSLCVKCMKKCVGNQRVYMTRRKFREGGGISRSKRDCKTPKHLRLKSTTPSRARMEFGGVTRGSSQEPLGSPSLAIGDVLGRSGSNRNITTNPIACDEQSPTQEKSIRARRGHLGSIANVSSSSLFDSTKTKGVAPGILTFPRTSIPWDHRYRAEMTDISTPNHIFVQPSEFSSQESMADTTTGDCSNVTRTISSKITNNTMDRGFFRGGPVGGTELDHHEPAGLQVPDVSGSTLACDGNVSGAMDLSVSLDNASDSYDPLFDDDDDDDMYNAGLLGDDELSSAVTFNASNGCGSSSDNNNNSGTMVFPTADANATESYATMLNSNLNSAGSLPSSAVGTISYPGLNGTDDPAGSQIGVIHGSLGEDVDFDDAMTDFEADFDAAWEEGEASEALVSGERVDWLADGAMHNLDSGGGTQSANVEFSLSAAAAPAGDEDSDNESDVLSEDMESVESEEE